ncbi:MAG TPA: PspC domain-containing protein [bacterium]|nr:PspC domain-containing protein [bacterium]
MFHEGKVSEEDYLRLSRAMARNPKQPETPEETVAKRGRLRKSWSNGVVGGLCAGLAEYLNVDVVVVRGIVIAAAILLSPLLILLYIILCSLTPWDDEQSAKALERTRETRLLVGTVAVFVLVIPTLYSLLVFPRLQEMYSNLGLSIWSANYQSSLPGRAIDCVSEYAGYVRLMGRAQPDEWLILGLLFLVAVFSLALIGATYSCFCKERMRKNFARATIGLSVLWFAFLVLGTLMPLLGIQR